MECRFIKVKGTWRDVADSCRTTIGKDAGIGEPTSAWKRGILFAEHSPIRQLIIKAKWLGLMDWVSKHFVRHWLGIIHWVSTSRSDRTGIDRNALRQDNPVTHEIEVNAQAIINISRRRLCRQASTETTQAWIEFLDSFRDVEPELRSVCVRECVYRNGLCPEYRTCKFNHTADFKVELAAYLKGMETRVGKGWKQT